MFTALNAPWFPSFSESLSETKSHLHLLQAVNPTFNVVPNFAGADDFNVLSTFTYVSRSVVLKAASSYNKPTDGPELPACWHHTGFTVKTNTLTPAHSPDAVTFSGTSETSNPFHFTEAAESASAIVIATWKCLSEPTKPNALNVETVNAEAPASHIRVSYLCIFHLLVCTVPCAQGVQPRFFFEQPLLQIHNLPIATIEANFATAAEAVSAPLSAPVTVSIQTSNWISLGDVPDSEKPKW